jgi:hypothetical protein
MSWICSARSRSSNLTGAPERRANGASIATETAPSRANSSAIDNMSRRELGMPCWTMSPAKGPCPSGTTTNAGTRPPCGLA